MRELLARDVSWRKLAFICKFLISWTSLKSKLSKRGTKKFQFVSSSSLFSRFPVSGQRDKYSARNPVVGAKGWSKGHPDILAYDPGSARLTKERTLSQPNWQESDRLGQRLSFVRQLLKETPCDLLMHPTFIHLRYSEIFFSFPHFMVHLFSRKMQRCVFNH